MSSDNPLTSTASWSDNVTTMPFKAPKSILDDMDEKAFIRLAIVLTTVTALVVIYICFKLWRSRRNRSRVRRYDILSTKQLQPDLIIASDDSEDELFERDDVTRHLVHQQQPSTTTGNLSSKQ